MDEAKLALSLPCPDHPSQLIGMLDVNPNAKKVAYCYGCLEKNLEDGIIIKTLKSLPNYVKENSSFYEKCRQRVQSLGEPPVNYIEELSKKGESLERFSKYIDQEKEKVKKTFEEIRKTVIQTINQKEEECLHLLDREALGLLEAYMQFEKLFSTGWPKPSDIETMYPELEVFMQKLSKIDNVDQLKAFMAGVQDDIQREKAYGMEEDGLEKRKSEIDRLIQCLNLKESSFPKAKSNFLVPENFEGLMKEFIQQPTQIENSIFERVNGPSYGSKIISNEQFEILKGWLPQGYKFDLKLLYRGSVDGMSSRMFHEKCDEKGPTITLVKCRFDGASESRNLGGFIDQSWNTKHCYSSSNEAFIFSISEQGNSVKCPVYYPSKAFFGSYGYGPTFGSDLEIEKTLQTGSVGRAYYFDTHPLLYGNVKTFRVEEVEVFQVE